MTLEPSSLWGYETWDSKPNKKNTKLHENIIWCEPAKLKVLESILFVDERLEHFKFVTCPLDSKKHSIFSSIPSIFEHNMSSQPPFPLWSPLGLDSPQPSPRHQNRPQRRTKGFVRRSHDPGIRRIHQPPISVYKKQLFLVLINNS